MKISTHDLTGRTTRRQRIGLGMAIALLGTLLAVQPEEARGAGGCNVRVVDKVNSMNEEYTYITGKPPFMASHTLRMSGTLMYYFCGYKVAEDRVKARWINWCWSFIEGKHEHFWFDGVTFNAYVWDGSGKNVNPPAHKVEDDGTIQNCERQMVWDAPWMLRKNDPRWRGNDHIHFNLLPDEEDSLKSPSTGRPVSYLRPAVDRTISKAHW